jgi:chitinase
VSEFPHSLLAWVLLTLVSTAVAETAPATGPSESAPRYVVYYNSDASPLEAILATDYTHVILSFVRVTVGDDGRLELQPPQHVAEQWQIVPKLRAAGKRVLVSYGGGLAAAAEYSALVGREDELASVLAAFVRKKQLDGIDIDFEASAMLHQRRPSGVGDGRRFLTTLTMALRKELPSPKYLLTHAPEPPYLDPAWHGGPYLDVLRQSGSQVDWITVQYYNNPGFDHPLPPPDHHTRTGYVALTSTDGVLGWPSSKILVGKPIYHDDASSGHLPPNAVIKQVLEPLLDRFGDQFGGLTGWQFSTLTDDHRAWNREIGPLLRAQVAPHSSAE